MEPDFWLERWQRGQIGFHAAAPHPRLLEAWPTLGVRPGARVLVPLSGKSLDLRWLADAGHDVVGVELSPLACRAFFDEQGWTPTVTREGPYTAWRAGRVTILEGDVFELPEDLGAQAVYDRAATVALPPDLRTRYAALLARALPAGAPMLLVAFDYPQEERAGPPFAVPEAEVRRLYGDAFTLQRLAHEPLADERGWGLSRLAEDTWRLVRRG
jgi:thiopurine S-methyltransferase